MPAYVHKMLLHSHEIMANLDMIPLGMTSEEAHESRNKDNKEFRLHLAKKDSRSHTMEDQFHYLFITSDPTISAINYKRITTKKKKIQLRTFPEEALDLIVAEINEIMEFEENSNETYSELREELSEESSDDSANEPFEEIFDDI